MQNTPEVVFHCIMPKEQRRTESIFEHARKNEKIFKKRNKKKIKIFHQNLKKNFLPKKKKRKTI